jgi:hypothetical protein
VSAVSDDEEEAIAGEGTVVMLSIRHICCAAAVTLGFSTMTSGKAFSQVKLDVTSDVARQAARVTTIDDLSVHDTAFVYNSPFCIKDSALYVPGWTSPMDLAATSYDKHGTVLKIEILPGKRLKGTFVDAAQAQRVARGATNAPSTLSKEDYGRSIISMIYTLFRPGLFGTKDCDEEIRTNTLRTTNLYVVDSLNGFLKISELLADAVSKTKP